MLPLDLFFKSDTEKPHPVVTFSDCKTFAQQIRKCNVFASGLPNYSLTMPVFIALALELYLAQLLRIFIGP